MGPSLLGLLTNIETSAIFFEALLDVPEKYIFHTRTSHAFADVSPMTHLKDSTIFDLPHPLGPTMPVRPFSIKKSVLSAKI